MEVLAENEAVALPRRKPVGRSSSMHARIVRPVAPTRSTDQLASMRAGSAQRANASSRTSTRPLMRSGSNAAGGGGGGRGGRAPPQRTSSVDSTNSLRAYRRDQLANTNPVGLRSVERKASLNGSISAMALAASGGGRGEPSRGDNLERHNSSQSVMTASDLSCFTMDSVNLRKSQLVADPIDDETYNDNESFADHDTRCSGFTDMEGVQGMERMTLERANSYSTITSALTSGFAEHEDGLLEEDELLEEDDEEEDLLAPKDDSA